MYLCCGDALFDLFLQNSQNPNESASKVHLTGDAGGSPLNVAVGLARLGQPSSFFTKLSSDMFGLRLREYFARNSVDASLCLDTLLPTTLAIVEKQADGSAAYSFQINNTADVSIAEADLPVRLPDASRVVHFGSYTTAVNPTADSLLRLARREATSRIISYDPNLRISIEPDIDRWRETFEGMSSCANLIKASDEDIESLMGQNQEDNFVADCFSNGAQLVFITRGPNGASGFKKDGSSNHHKGVSVSVVDTVGAGDTFQAAILHWLGDHNHVQSGTALSGELDLTASMNFAIKAAAITCTRNGADLPFLHDLS